MSQKSTTSMRRIRTVVRCVALIAAVVLLLPNLPWPQARLVVPAASPFIGIATSIAARSLGAVTLVCVPVLGLVLIRRRWFCRWACPIGLMTECAGQISPVSPARCKRVPRLGISLVVLSLSAAVVGYPLFLWLDPLAMFTGTFGLIIDATNVAAITCGALLATVLLLSYALPGTWCLKLCPLGAAQELLAMPYHSVRRKKKESVAPSDELITEPMTRRSLLATAVGATCAVAGVPLGLFGRARGEGAHTPTLRPPGAAAEWQFGQLCVRCGNCVRTCPSRIITTRWQSESWSNWLAPEVSFVADYCREDCIACMQVCPSGALREPVYKRKPSIGLAHVLMDRCLLVQGRECQTMCLTSCPYEAITLHQWTWEDDRRYPIVIAEKCPGCGACQVACTPMDAIVVRPGGSVHTPTQQASG